MSYLSELCETMSKLSSLSVDVDKSILSKVTHLAESLMGAATKLDSALHEEGFADTAAHLEYCAKTIRPLMDSVRGYADALEGEVSDKEWPLPSYEEMLFLK